MTPQDAQLLDAFWSWVRGIAGVIDAGFLAGAALGATVGMLPLAWSRRDWRPPAAMLGLFVLFVLGGSWALFTTTAPAPSWPFWLTLSVQIGALSFTITAVSLGRLSVNRLRQDRLASEVLSRPLDPAVEQETAVHPQSRGRLTGIEAEYYVAEWMRYLGAVDARVTPARRDGGIDVRSTFYVAQVKHRPGDFVSVDMIRSLLGAASLERRATIFFSSGQYSRDARELAREAGMALFMFRHQENRLIPVNPLARQLQLQGLASRPPAVREASLSTRAVEATAGSAATS